MDQPGVLRAAGLAAAVAALTLGLAACGGGASTTTTGGSTTTASAGQQAPLTDDRSGLVKPDPASDAANRNPSPLGPSVTYNDPPPPVAAGVQAAAQSAGCTVKSWPSEANPQNHIDGDSATAVSSPPLSGAHSAHWADWGVYDQPVPFKYQLHNLEHGGVFVHYGRDVSVEGVNAIREWWAKSPAFLLVAPDTASTFPTNAVVVGSQQRWLVCKPFSPAQITAIDAFAKEYRGRGPEQAKAVNAGNARPDGLPAPAIPDTGAEV